MNGSTSIATVTIIDVLMAISLYLPFSTGALFILPIGSMAVGAYTFGWMALHQSSSALATIAGILAGAALTAVGGGLAIRLRGWEAAIASFAMAEIVQVFFFNFGPTGGASGLAGVPLSTTFGKAALICLIIVVGLVTLEFSRLGLLVRVIRADELVAECTGIRVRRLRITLYTLSGAVAGAAGVLSAGLLGIVDPTSYGLGQLNQYLLGTVLGGSTTVLGSTAGGVIIGILPNVTAALSSFSVVAFSIIILILMVVRREGLITTASVIRTARLLHLRPYRRRHFRSSRAPTGVPGNGAELRVKAVCKSFGGARVLADVNMVVKVGEIHGLIGSNGAGKTTLLNIISGVVRPDEGEIRLDGKETTRWRPSRLVRFGLTRTFQNIRLSDDLTVREHVDAAARTDVADVMEMMGLRDTDTHRPHSLPYGLQRKIEIARALAPWPRMLLLDEPTAGMSAAEVQEISAAIRRIRDAGISVLVIDHNVGFIRKVAERITVLDFGRVIADGVPDEVITDKTVIDTYLGKAAVERLVRDADEETHATTEQNRQVAHKQADAESGELA